MDQKVKLLSKVPLLAALDRRGLEEIARLADEVDLPADRVVTRQGASAAEFFVIIDGTVRVDRDGKHVRDLGPGDFFGELALLGEVPRTATVTCITPCRLLVVGHREFHSLLSKFPTIQTAVLDALGRRIALLEGDLHHH